ncbi:hypothetical protein [Ktedonospora formicarum]|uniref:hypothetical protein n=1 Tax=Ktedonospora formicarum TaxID=2778364 RepID=UPI001C6916AB|nr:hypothetical protein [Ktedonospora formicarum]
MHGLSRPLAHRVSMEMLSGLYRGVESRELAIKVTASVRGRPRGRLAAASRALGQYRISGQLAPGTTSPVRFDLNRWDNPITQKFMETQT